MAKPTSKTFSAQLVRSDSDLGWTIIRLPFDSATLWGTRGNLRVKGEINGHEFSAALLPNGRGGHVMLVNKKMQKAAGVAVGSQVKVRMERDFAVRAAPKSAELDRMLAKSKKLRNWHDEWSPSLRKYIVGWVAEPKGAAARARRAEQLAERMLETMEAERELPPMLRAIFAEEPHALEGWKRMTERQRRGELFGIFYYREPDSRERRARKAAELAARSANKR